MTAIRPSEMQSDAYFLDQQFFSYGRGKVTVGESTYRDAMLGARAIMNFAADRLDARTLAVSASPLRLL